MTRRAATRTGHSGRAGLPTLAVCSAVIALATLATWGLPRLGGQDGGRPSARIGAAPASRESSLLIRPVERVVRSVVVAPGASQLSVLTSWPGSDVVTTLVSPSGRRIDRATTAPDLGHRALPRMEVYSVRSPEAGTWTIEVYGEDVAPQGEPVILRTSVSPRRNMQPVVGMAVAQQGSTVTVSATGPGDPEGGALRYRWSFGDGQEAATATATHTYAAPGTYRLRLVAFDPQGAPGFADSRLIQISASP